MKSRAECESFHVKQKLLRQWLFGTMKTSGDVGKSSEKKGKKELGRCEKKKN